MRLIIAVYFEGMQACDGPSLCISGPPPAKGSTFAAGTEGAAFHFPTAHHY